MDSANNGILLQLLREISSKTPQYRASKKLENKERAKLEGNRDYCKRQLIRIMVRDGGICQICDKPVVEPSRDHVISLGDYRQDPSLCSLEYLRSDENVRLACGSCNQLIADEAFDKRNGSSGDIAEKGPFDFLPDLA